MKRLILLILGVTLLAMLLTLAGVLSAANLVPPALFGAAMILAMLQLVAESDRKP